LKFLNIKFQSQQLNIVVKSYQAPLCIRISTIQYNPKETAKFNGDSSLE